MWCLLGQHKLIFIKTCVSELLINISVVTRRSFLRVFSSNLVFSVCTVSYGPRFFLSDLWLVRSNSAGLSVKFAQTHSYFIIFLAWVFACQYARTIVYVSSSSAVFENSAELTNSWSSVIWELKRIRGIICPVFTKVQGIEENKFYVCDVEIDISCLIWFNMEFFPSNVHDKNRIQ